jgi:hypothetical protein
MKAAPKDLKQWDLIFFRSEDHTTSEDGWMSLPDAMKETPAVIEGVGFLVSVDDRVIRLANSHINNEDVATVWIVPLGCLTELYVLKPGKINYAQRKGNK